MSAPAEKRIALDRYARMLRAALVSPCSVAYLGPGEMQPWLAEGSDAPAFEAILRELGGFDQAAVSAEGAQRLDLGAGRCLLHAAVVLGADRVGRIVVMHESGLPEPRLAALEAMLLDVVACAGDEYRVAEEADALAGELSARYEELNLLYSFEGSVPTGDDALAGTERMMRNLVERLDIDVAALVLPDRPAPIHVSGLAQPLRDIDLVLTAIRGDLFRFATTTRGPVVMNDAADPRRQYLFVNMPYRILACPVIDQGQTRAMLVLLRVGGRPEFVNGDRNLGMVIANQMAIMMQNHAMLRSLAGFGEDMAAALIEAIEAKDPYTRGHSERVQKGAVALGNAAELSSEVIEHISWGALLHDVGKIGIPDSIICKAGKLSDDEYSMIKTHSERSFEILRHIDHLRADSLDAARHHHERFDGGGYPHGLRGKQIPIGARVVSIADTYDAVTSSRSYRAGRPHDVALEIIRGVAGTQLDPDLVTVFDNMWSRHDPDLSALKEPDADDG